MNHLASIFICPPIFQTLGVGGVKNSSSLLLLLGQQYMVSDPINSQKLLFKIKRCVKLQITPATIWRNSVFLSQKTPILMLLA
jgi:hypothetical protein